MPQAADKTLADYVVTAISPVLIMALVGSLVFFLVEVLYVGQYQGTLLYILFFFVFGAVLISRISMTQQIAGRAGLYGLVLGGLTWFALLQYVEYPAQTPAAEWGWAINLGLIALIWWSAHRLTWDCTMIEDEEDATGAGLLEVAGLDRGRAEEPGKPAGAGPQAGGAAKRRKDREPPLAAWWKRYLRYREERRHRPHTPGVWVVYFSLAALPLYGLGQSLIPPEDAGRRRHAFWLMTVYVASGLGLLLTTCFLGLRRYLRQRKLRMPAAMTGVWLLTGAALIAAFLVVGMLLPRPSPEIALVKLPWLPRSQGRDASRSAVRGGEAGKGEGRPGPEGKEGEEPGAEGSEENPKQPGEAGKGRGGSQKGARKGTTSTGRGEKTGQNAAGGTERNRDRQGGSSQTKDKQDKHSEAKGGGQGEEKERDDRARGGGNGDRSPRQGGRPRSSPGQSGVRLPEWGGQIGRILKWVVLIAFGLLVGFLLLRALLTFLANFTGWARNLLDALQAFWQALWRKGKERDDSGAGGGQEEAAPAVPFRSFPDPFATGRARGMAVGELVRYTFEALQAWARERNLARYPGETPLEFAARVGEEVPALEEGVRRLAGYYTGLAYARRALADDCREPLRQFWATLVDVAERPLSAGSAR
jgi:hypothetical protein